MRRRYQPAAAQLQNRAFKTKNKTATVKAHRLYTKCVYFDLFTPHSSVDEMTHKRPPAINDAPHDFLTANP